VTRFEDAWSSVSFASARVCSVGQSQLWLGTPLSLSSSIGLSFPAKAHPRLWCWSFGPEKARKSILPSLCADSGLTAVGDIDKVHNLVAPLFPHEPEYDFGRRKGKRYVE
jgi:hypothetical protein